MVDPNLAIDEKIIHVDENNNVIGSTTRKEMVSLLLTDISLIWNRESIIIGIDPVVFLLTIASKRVFW